MKKPSSRNGKGRDEDPRPPDPPGVPANVCGRDITGRNRAEEALRRAKDEWERTFDSVPDLIAILDDQHRVVRANKAMADRLGATPNDCIGLHCYKVVHGTDAPPPFCPHSHTLADGKPHLTEVHEDRLGGDFLVSTTPLHGADGRMIGTVHVARDITERKAAEEALRVSEEKYRSLFENMLDGYAHCQMLYENDAPRDFVYLDVNGAFEHMTGLTGVVGKKVSEVIPGIQQSNPELFQIYGRVALTGNPERFETWVESLGIWFSISVYSPRKDHFVAVFDNITERKRAEEALRQAAEELKRSNQDLEHFAYVASHDLQEPLRMVSGFLRLLEERYKPQLDEKAQEYIGYSVEGATRMSQLISDLLAYSRVGHKDAKHEPVDANRPLATALANLRVSIDAAGAVVTHDDLPTVTADPTQLTQLFQNLIGNAIKFRHPDRPCQVHISVKQGRREGSQEGKWVFAVRDNGIGIAPDQFERVFVIFQRLHAREKYPGTGIGLAICKKIVEQHRGKIWIDSQAGEGSTFGFTLPEEKA